MGGRVRVGYRFGGLAGGGVMVIGCYLPMLVGWRGV